MMKRITLILVLSIVANLGFNQTLDDYLKTAAENNPGLKSTFSAYLASMEKVDQVGTLPEPQVVFAYFISPVETRVGAMRAKVSLTQKFPWFGLLDAKQDAATEMAKVKYEAFEQQKSKLFFDVKSMYYNIYFVERSIGISQQNLEILNSMQQLALAKIESGKVSVADELRVEMAINELNNKLAYLEDAKDYLKKRFNLLLNVSIDSDVQLQDSLPHINFSIDEEAYKDSISVNNHKLKQLEHRVLTWKKQELIADQSRKPMLSVGMDYTFISQSDNPMISTSENGKDAIVFPKVMLTVPIYRKKYDAAVKEVQLNMESTEHKKEEVSNQLTGLMEKAFKDLRDAKRRKELFLKQTVLAQQTLEILQVSYIAKGSGFEEMLRIEQKLLKYKLELTKAYTDENAAIAFVEFLAGK